MSPLHLFALFFVLHELVAYLANDMIMPGMLQVIQAFHASQTYVALSLNFYILGDCVLLLFVGGMAERYGKRLIMLLGNLFFLIFTLVITLSQNIHQFIFWRFLEGAGLSIITLGYGMIHQNFNDKEAVKLISLMGNVSVMAPLLGPVMGSIIVSHFSWHYVFYFTGILSVISLIGLCLYTPREKKEKHPVKMNFLIKQYGKIARDKSFLQGTLAATLSIMPILFWISQAPNLIFYKLHLSYMAYAVYQVVSVGGMVVSGFLMQWFAGKYRIATLINMGAYLSLVGLVWCAIGSAHIQMIAVGQFIYTFGLGFSYGCMMRLIVSNKLFSSSMLSMMFGFFQALLFFIAICFSDRLFQYFDYSLLSFTLGSLSVGAVAFWVMRGYMKGYQLRGWE